MKTWEDLFDEEEFITDLVFLLKIPSVMETSNTDDAPFGQNVQKALHFLLEKGNEEGLFTYEHQGKYGYIEYGPEDAEDYIGILCHINVVPASGDWSNDPFTPVIKENKIFARGAINDKGPTIAAWHALKLLKKAGVPIKHRIRLIIGTNEESGMRCMKSYVENEPQALFGFAPDAAFPIIHAEKGQINLKLQCKSKQPTNDIKLLTFQAGSRGNMVPDTASACIKGDFSKEDMETLHALERDNDNLSIEYTNDSTITLHMSGISAHGMEPFKGVNAAFALVDTLLLLKASQLHPYLTFINTYLKNDFYGENLGIDITDRETGKLTVNAGVFEYDDKKGGEISLNIRCPIKTNYEKTIEQLKALAHQKGWQVSGLRYTTPHYVDANHPGVLVLQQAYTNMTQDEAPLLTTGGATYARFLKNGVAFGAVFPGKENTAHHADEYAELEDLKKAVFIYAEALSQLGNL